MYGITISDVNLETSKEMKTDTMKSKRLEWLDLIRGFLMILVYIYHSEVFYGNGHSWSWVFNPIFLTGFFFVWGYLFSDGKSAVSLSRKWKQVCRSILIPYFIITISFLVPKIIFLHYDWKVALSDIILLRASWFVIAIGVLQLIYGLLFRYTKKISNIIILSCLLFFSGYLFVYLNRIRPEWLLNNPILHSDLMTSCMPLCINLALLAIPFFITGIIYRRYEGETKAEDNIKKGLAILILYVVLVTVNHFTIKSDLTFAACACNDFAVVYSLFIISMYALILISRKIDRIQCINYIGKNSLLFYFFNILLLRISGFVYDKTLEIVGLSAVKEYIGYGNEIIVSLIAVASAFPIVWMINKYFPILSGKSFPKKTN